MARAKRRDYAGALASYTAAIDLVGVPTDVRAMALYNRALAYVAAGDDTRGVNDLESVMAIDGAMALVNIRTMAAQKLARVESRINTSDSQKR